MRTICMIILSFLFLICTPAKIWGQAPGEENASNRGPSIGVTFGGGTLPTTFFNGCILEDRFNSQSASASAAILFGVPVGPLTLLTHTTVNAEAVLGPQDACTDMQPAHESGVHVDRLRKLQTGSFVTTDLRLGYEFPTRYPVVGSAGGGWALGHDIPFWDASIGVRTPGRRIRWGLDLAFERYRMPFELVTREWENLEVIQVLDRETEREWQNSWQFRVGAELVMR